MSKKTVVSVDLLCSKCKKWVMKSIASIEDINSIVLDPSKNTATVIGDADPAQIIKKLRKCRRSAAFVSIGPAKEEKKDDKKDKKDEKKENFTTVPKTCQRCEVWYVIGEHDYNYCSIL
ncbi:heavy metal-associated isoprenylated plant protein 2-like [Asparagus officinalis]|uniref:heavy metal-associated isoprenylated plant protein 2-like n=1 Tax=Asparagus officinalis TaxID=4686 RepID=UPI00098E099C|nr:heavy metal-associated isoprenylated plant protein 2-like [Asparagus officinalis]